MSRPASKTRALLGGLAAGILLAGLGIVATPASADTLVYTKGGFVYVSRADGSDARTVSPQSQWWAWPSESDNGTIAVAGGAARVNSGGATESSGSSEIYAFDQQGTSLLSTPVNTPGSFSGPSNPTYVQHFRVSPDGGTVAYGVVGCCGFSGQTTFTSPLRAGASWTQFQDDYIDPEWVDGNYVIDQSSALALTHAGPTVTGTQPQYGIFDAADNSDNLGWYGDAAIPDGWDYQASFTHNTHTVALFLDDAPDVGGTAQHARIHLETIGPRPDFNETDACTIELPANQYAAPHDTAQASLSFSTDGSLLVWGQDDGIYEANVSDPTNCAAINASRHEIVAGGAMPSFGAAALSPAAGPPETAIDKAKVNAKKGKAKFTFDGSGGVGSMTFECSLDGGKAQSCTSPWSYKHLKAGKHKFEVSAVDSRGTADPSPAKEKFKIKKRKHKHHKHGHHHHHSRR